MKKELTAFQKDSQKLSKLFSSFLRLEHTRRKQHETFHKFTEEREDIFTKIPVAQMFWALNLSHYKFDHYLTDLKIDFDKVEENENPAINRKKEVIDRTIAFIDFYLFSELEDFYFFFYKIIPKVQKAEKLMEQLDAIDRKPENDEKYNSIYKKIIKTGSELRNTLTELTMSLSELKQLVKLQQDCFELSLELYAMDDIQSRDKLFQVIDFLKDTRP